MLDDAVFERVEADHGHPATRRERIERAEQRGAQLTELVVDGYPQRLESACRGMFTVVPPYRPAHDLSELQRPGDRRDITCLHEGPRDALGMAFFT